MVAWLARRPRVSWRGFSLNEEGGTVGVFGNAEFVVEADGLLVVLVLQV